MSEIEGQEGRPANDVVTMAAAAAGAAAGAAVGMTASETTDPAGAQHNQNLFQYGDDAGQAGGAAAAPFRGVVFEDGAQMEDDEDEDF